MPIQECCSPLNRQPKQPSPFTSKGLPKSPGAFSNPSNSKYKGGGPVAPNRAATVELPVGKSGS
jgi:hypothetical protein